MKEVSSVEEFDNLLQESNLVVDFYGTWCLPCRKLTPILEQLETTDDTQVVKIDVDGLSDLASRYNIMGIPNIKFIKKGGEVIDEVVGLTTLEVLQNKMSLLKG